jgi:FkbH-like protein
LNKKEIKCVVWDLDNTVWDGVLLESDNITLKTGIKNILESLDSRGILNSIASKNNHDDAYKKLKEFKIDHYFLYPQINWNAKSVSISKIQESLNIGIDSFAFIDDQIYEREEVSAEYPDVYCIDAIEYDEILNFDRFNPRFITEDSKRRRLMYIEEIDRKREEESFQGPQEQFLASLNMKFRMSEAKEEDLKRAEELTIRTNQLNATGKTYDYDELYNFMISDKYKLLVCELTDKYGSYGKIGLALIQINEENWHIKLLLMSCRVISRGVGTVLLTHILQEAKKNTKKVIADFRQTDRNKMMFVSYKFANFKNTYTEEGNDSLLENNLEFIQKMPPYIELILN